MKTEEELKAWFFDLYNSCYVIRENINIDYLYYDIDFIRKYKFNDILDNDIEYPKKPKGDCLFGLDWNINYMYIDYMKIWLVLSKEYSKNDKTIAELIKSWLNEDDKLKIFIPIGSGK